MKKYIAGNSASAGIMCVLLHFSIPLTVNAAESYNSGDWEYSANVYLWMAGMKGDTNNGAEFDIGFDELIRNLNMAFMGGLEARNGA